MKASDSNRNELYSSEFLYSNECCDVSFRIDFYSRKDFISKFQQVASEIIGDFSERLLSDEEAERIDIVSLAANLENSTNEIVDRKAFIFKWKGDATSGSNSNNIEQVIVSPYFIFVYCRGDKATINSIKRKFETIASYMPELTKDISMVGIRFSSGFIINVDKEYFPFFGLRFYDPDEFQEDSQSYEMIFTEKESDDIDIICRVKSCLSQYIAIPESDNLLGTIKAITHSYSSIKCQETDCLIQELDKLICVTEKYTQLCAR